MVAILESRVEVTAPRSALDIGRVRLVNATLQVHGAQAKPPAVRWVVNDPIDGDVPCGSWLELPKCGAAGGANAAVKTAR